MEKRKEERAVGNSCGKTKGHPRKGFRPKSLRLRQGWGGGVSPVLGGGSPQGFSSSRVQ